MTYLKKKKRLIHFIGTFELSSRSLLFSRAWLVLNTIQSNSALYSDLAMESLTVPACVNTNTHTRVKTPAAQGHKGSLGFS